MSNSKRRVRVTKKNISDVVMEIACGLHNLRVTFRQPMQTMDITNSPYAEMNLV